MNLVLDFGNTARKLALFKGDELVKYHSFHNIREEGVLRFCSGYDVKRAILSSVIKVPALTINFLKKDYSFINMDENIPLPVKNLYETPSTLGKDRLACAVAAAKMFPAANVLCIDAGTCIKYDLVTAGGEYIGGAISLGLEMRFKALHRYTAKLPLLKVQEFGKLVGLNTKDSLLSGVMNGSLAEVSGIIERYNKEYDGLKVIITGGDAAFFEDKLKSRIFAVPHLVLHGLNHILNYNAVKKK